MKFYGGRVGQYPIAERMSEEMMFTDRIKSNTTYEELDKMAEALIESGV